MIIVIFQEYSFTWESNMVYAPLLSKERRTNLILLLSNITVTSLLIHGSADVSKTHALGAICFIRTISKLWTDCYNLHKRGVWSSVCRVCCRRRSWSADRRRRSSIWAAGSALDCEEPPESSWASRPVWFILWRCCRPRCTNMSCTSPSLLLHSTYQTITEHTSHSH